MSNATVLIDDVAGRFKKGERGCVLENNSTKYDYLVQLEGSILIPPMFGGGTGPRAYYFYREEILLDRNKGEHGT